MPPRKPATPLGRTVVHVQVGKCLQDFAIHKAFICHHSPYFRAAFTSGFEETKTGIMKLPKTRTRIFDLFFQWLYTQTLWDESADESEWPTMENLLKLWVFADMARIPRLTNQCLDALKSISDALDKIVHGIAWVWQNSAMGSPIRRFLIDSIVWEMKAEDLANDLIMWPAEARVEIVLAMVKLLESLQMADGKTIASPLDDMSKYHQPEQSKQHSQISLEKVSKWSLNPTKNGYASMSICYSGWNFPVTLQHPSFAFFQTSIRPAAFISLNSSPKFACALVLSII